MKVELIFVGSELVSGKTLNTNASYISKKLKELGHNCYMQYTVDDNKEVIKDTLSSALSKSDLVIVSGGLGPTDDDLTKEAVAEALGLELVENERCKKHLENYFERLGKIPTENNFKQITAPRNAIIFPNDIGTACGMCIEYGKRRVVLLPGPPKELTYMFDAYITPFLKKTSPSAVESQTINVFGMGESAIETIIKPFCNLDNPSVVTYCKENECEISVTASAGSYDAARQLCAKTVSQIKELLGDVVYGTNSNGLAFEAVNLLRKSGLKVATAESCTGGMLSQALTSVPHASDAVEIGILAYSSRIKNEALSVPLDVLLEEGAISAETAMYLAKNVRILSDSDIGIGITGNAGPSASENKPVGLVYVSIADKTKYYVKKLELPESYGREKIRSYATLTALDLIRRYVISRPSALEGMISFEESFSFPESESISSNSISEENFTVFEVDEDYDFDKTIPLVQDNSNEYILEDEKPETAKEAKPSMWPVILAFLKKHWLKLASIAVLIALVICSAFVIGNFMHESRQKKLLEEAREVFNYKLDEKASDTGIYTAFNPLIEQNADIKAWLIVGSTSINNPVYQAKDNKFYCNHNMVKEKSPYGALFFDYKNAIKKDGSDQNLTIYGNNTNNKTMFGELDSYRSLSFYKSNSVIKLKTLYDEYEYVIFAVFVTNSDPKHDNGYVFNYTQSNFNSPEELDAFVTEAKTRSLISVPVEVGADDAIITLSTSANDFSGARFVVMAKQLGDNDIKLSKSATLNANAKYPQIWYDNNGKDGFSSDSAPTSSEPSSDAPSSDVPSSEPSSDEPSSDVPSSSAPSSSQQTPSTPATPCEHSSPENFTKTDGTNHSYSCTKCGQTVSQAHIFTENVADDYIKDPATCKSPATYFKSCVCGAESTEFFESGEPDPDKHTPSEQFEGIDDNNHWKICEDCSTVIPDSTEPHNFANGSCECGKTQQTTESEPEPDPAPTPTE